jgi:hypothetical protein
MVGNPDTSYTTSPLPANIIGTWVDNYDTWTISATEVIYETEIAGVSGGFKSTYVGHRSNGTSGYITVRYTVNDMDVNAAGKYYVIHYQNLTATTVSIGGAANLNDPGFIGAAGGQATAAAAEATYTLSANYFSHTHYVKMIGTSAFPNALQGEWEDDWGMTIVKITDRTVEVLMDFFGVFILPVFKAEIIDMKNEGATGYFVLRYLSTTADQNIRQTYTVMRWEDFETNSVSLAVAGGNASLVCICSRSINCCGSCN